MRPNLAPNLPPNLAHNLAPNLASIALITSLAGLAALAWLAPARAEVDFRARVVSIGDGDTIRIQHGDKLETIRLACIDAPEMAQVPYGDQARRYLQIRLPLQRQVTIHPLNTEVIGDVNLNLALVEDGQAFVYPKYLGQCDANEYLDAEYRASRHRFGIWRVPGGIERPWLFRHGRQQERQQQHQKGREQGRPQDRLPSRLPNLPAALI